MAVVAFFVDEDLRYMAVSRNLGCEESTEGCETNCRGHHFVLRLGNGSELISESEANLIKSVLLVAVSGWLS